MLVADLRQSLKGLPVRNLNWFSHALDLVLTKVVAAHGPIGAGERASLLDRVYAYRILLGRMPSSEELVSLKNASVTWREFIRGLLGSPEYRVGGLDFLPSGIELMSEINGFRFWFSSSDREMGAKMATGAYEPEVTQYLTSTLTSGMCVLDVGAQTGWYSIHMARCVGQGGRVFSFEPFSASYSMLEKNVEENRLSDIIAARNIACGATSGVMKAGVASGMIVAEPDNGVSIECVALDDVVEGEVHLCKLDVEGHEPQVIAGMKRIIEKSRPILVTEMNAYWLKKIGSSIDDYSKLLQSLDYRLLDIDRQFKAFGDFDRNDALCNINVLALPN